MIDYIRRLGVRTMQNGVMVLPRANFDAEDFMDTNFVRLSPGVRQWVAKTDHAKPHTELFDDNTPDAVYIIGKGQSIDTLTPEDFEYDYPIFCVNEAIQAIQDFDIPNPLIFASQDQNVVIKEMRPDIICLAAPWLMRRLARFEHLYYVDGYVTGRGTTAMCVYVAKTLGVDKIILDGCDYFQSRNRRYSSTIERNQNTSVGSLIRVTQQLSDELKGVNYKFNRPL